MEKVTRIKPDPRRWDVENYHHHPNYLPLKRDFESTNHGKAKEHAAHQSPSKPSVGAVVLAVSTDRVEVEDDEYGGDVFEEMDFAHPDGICLDRETSPFKDDGLLQGRNGGVPAQIASLGPPQQRQTYQPSTVQTPKSQQPQPGSTIRQQQPNLPPPIFRPNHNQQHPGVQQTSSRLQANQQPHNIQQSNPSHGVQPNAQPSVGRGTTGQIIRPTIEPVNPAATSHPPKRDASHQDTQLVIDRTETPLLDSALMVDNIENGDQSAGFKNPYGLLNKEDRQKYNVPVKDKPTDFDPQTPWQGAKTNGINHSRSGPVKRQMLEQNGQDAVNGQMVSNGNRSAPQVRPNFVNPQADMHRKIGMPNGAMQSPLAGRMTTSYKAPGPAPGKRPMESIARPALTDMSNGQSRVEGPDAKRIRLESPSTNINTTVGEKALNNDKT